MLLPAVDSFTETDDVFWGNVEQQSTKNEKKCITFKCRDYASNEFEKRVKTKKHRVIRQFDIYGSEHTAQ